MALLPIYTAPHPVLKQKAESVAKVTDDIRQTLDDMLETMYDAPGIGLAAPQVGISKRMLVMDINHRNERYPDTADGPTEKQPYKIINPEIVAVSDDDATYNEGCLSVPEHYADVARPRTVSVKYLDENGDEQLLEADGLLATCLQHEIDHLDGILFIDHLSSLKRNMILRKMLKAKKLAGK